MAIVHLHPLCREVAAHGALTHRPPAGQTGEATIAAALSLCPPRHSSPSPMKVVRRVLVQLMTCSSIPGTKVQCRRILLPDDKGIPLISFSIRTHILKATKVMIWRYFKTDFKIGVQNCRPFICTFLNLFSFFFLLLI